MPQTCNFLSAPAMVARATQLQSLVREDLTREHFGDIIGACVGRNGIPAEAVSEQFDVAVSSVCRWKQGRSAPSAFVRFEIVQWIAKQFLGTEEESVDALLEDVERMIRELTV